MLLQKEKRVFVSAQLRRLLLTVLGCFAVLSGPVCNSFAAQSEVGDLLLQDSVSEKAEGMLLPEDANLASGGYKLADQVCALIYQGDFETADKLIDQNREAAAKDSRLSQLSGIIAEHKELQQRRQAARQTAYRKQLKKLEKFRSKADSNDVNDVNDANNLTSVLSVIAQAAELADDRQKSELLSTPYVTQTLDKAKTKSAEFQAEGNWLDAYTGCYYFLKAIDEDNKQYSEHADQLIDRANIKASLKDSPCETTKDRYNGVKESMFKRAVEALNFNYVSIDIGYGRMLIKGIDRCKLLADVARLSSLDNSDNEPDSYYLPSDPAKLAAWSAAMDALLDEVKALQTGMSKDKFLDFFDKVLELNKATAEFPEAILVAQFTEAALSALDPYTTMIWPKQRQDFEKIMTNKFTGIGIEIARQNGWLTVASLLPDTPAYKSGLDAGDVIEAVDGQSTKDMSLTCAVRQITGPAGTDVTLTVKSAGDDNRRDIVITRGEITVPTIRGWNRSQSSDWSYMLDDVNRVGYVRITNFSEKTADDLEDSLDKLEADGLKGLILDLRFNTGGLLNSAIELTDKFVSKGLIVSTRPRFGVWSYASAEPKNTHPNYPLVMLVNRDSASASEIFAGALQDPMHKRAVLVGQRTRGKGSVQGITSYPAGGAQLKYTMAYYHLPSGERVESKESVEKEGRSDWGVGPDVEVKLTNDELRKMLEFQRDNDVLAQADRQNKPQTLNKHNIEDTLSTDPQLAIALLVVKTKLVQANALVRN